VDFTADGRHVIVGGAERATVFIDATNGKVSRRIDPDADPAGHLYVSEDGRRFGTGRATSRSRPQRFQTPYNPLIADGRWRMSPAIAQGLPLR